MAKRFIQKAIKKPGALRRALGVSGEGTIPVSRVQAAAKKGGKLGQRARFALLLRKFGKRRRGGVPAYRGRR